MVWSTMLGFFHFTLLFVYFFTVLTRYILVRIQNTQNSCYISTNYQHIASLQIDSFYNII